MVKSQNLAREHVVNEEGFALSQCKYMKLQASNISLL
jgi:hypothetical protein